MSKFDQVSDFNPRSPCGERLFRVRAITMTASISIHAPHAGSGRKIKGVLVYERKFQSTLPMRGAAQATIFTFQAALISIHAPHAGSGYTSSARQNS